MNHFSQSNRYSRQEKIIGKEGQQQVSNKHVLVIGAGALGSVMADLLVRAGIGSITIVDGDFTELSNLQRQNLYNEEDVSEKMPKVYALKKHLERINSNVQIEVHFTELSANNIDLIAKDVDLIMDGTDNQETRLLMNDYAFKNGIPWVYGAVAAGMGYSFAFVPEETSCYRCMVGDLPSNGGSCDQMGVLSSITHMIASYQFSEALKILSGNFHLLNPKMLFIDLLRNLQFFISQDSSNECKSCSEQATFPNLVPNVDSTNRKLYDSVMLCGKEVVQFRLYDKQNQPISSDTYFYRSLKEKKVDIFEASWFFTCTLDGLIARFLKDGRVFMYCDDIHKSNLIFEKYFLSLKPV